MRCQAEVMAYLTVEQGYEMGGNLQLSWGEVCAILWGGHLEDTSAEL